MRFLLALFVLLPPFRLAAQFSAQRLIDHTAVNSPGVVKLADMDGDGDLDSFVTTGYPERGPIWFPNRGDGVFLPRRVVVAAMNHQTTQLVDLDQDGDLDLVGSSTGPTELYWFPNDGTGQFGSRRLMTAQFGYWDDMDVADMDGDGDLDVLVATSNEDRVVWYTNDGEMNFGAPQVIAEVEVANAVCTADLDGDGDLDVVTGSNMNTAQAWYRNNGSGSFTPMPQSDVFFALWVNVLAEDVDGDGDPDIVGQLTGSGWTRWYANDGTGQFSEGIDMSTSGYFRNMKMGDLDGDQDPDLITCESNRLRWWMNDGAGNFTLGAILVNFLAAGGTDIGDFSGDGIADVIATFGTANRVTTSVGLGSGTFAAYQTIGTVADEINSIVVADLDGDGLNDVVEAVGNENKLAWFRNEGYDRFSIERPLNSFAQTINPIGSTCVRAADVDGDGDLDLFSRNWNNTIAWTANDGTGNFGALQQIGSNVFNGPVLELGDMDGDGDADLLACGNNSLMLYLNDGTGTFDTEVVIDPGIVDKILVVDLDDDGDLDMLTGGNSIKAHLNQGGGSFTLSYTEAVSPGSVFAITTLDMDDDGDLDLVYNIAYDVGGNQRWRANTGAGDFDDSPVSILDVGWLLAATDLDGDGRKDLLTLVNDTLCWANNLGAGQFSTPHAVGAPGANSIIAFGDPDNDGDLDVFTGSTSEGRLAWHENYFLSAQKFEGTVFRDMNGDGIRTSDEPGIANLPVEASPSIPAIFSAANGQYTAHVDIGSYEVTTGVDPSLWTVSTPSPINVPITAQQPIVTGVDVGIDALMDTTILIPSITLAPAVCGAQTTLWLSIMNAGTRIEQCELTLELSPLFTFVSSTPSPSATVGNTMRWTLEPLPYFATVTIPIVVVTPDVSMIDSPYVLTLNATSYDEGSQPLGSATTTLQGTVLCSYDPNDKLVSPRGYGVYGALELDRDTLDYAIRFQNTGNAPATTVMLRDRLDPTLDPERIQVLGYSHPFSLIRVEADGELVVRFDGIQLPGAETDSTGSQGFIRFRIRPYSDSLQHLSAADNTAEIYFDLNEPVITNTTRTTWVDCSLWQPSITTSMGDLLVAEAGDSYQWYMNDVALPGATERGYVTTMSGTYFAQVTSGFGCIANTSPITVVSTAIPTLNDHTVQVRPNPFNSTSELVFTEVLGSNDRILLYDMEGRLLRTWNGNGTNQLWLSRGDLRSGVYLLQVHRTNTRVALVRVIVE